MASLQARHQRSCPLYPWTPFAKATKAHGCNCNPLYYTHHRAEGKTIREIVGHNRKEARRALDALRGDVARRRYRVLQDKPFDAWADEWLAAFTGKANSKRVYATTLKPAKAVFGKRRVRDLGAADVRRFLDHIREEHKRRHARSKDEAVREGEVSPATLAKHLHQLGASRPRLRRATPSGTPSASGTRPRARRCRSPGPPTTPTRSWRGSGRSSPTGPSTSTSAKPPS